MTPTPKIVYERRKFRTKIGSTDCVYRATRGRIAWYTHGTLWTKNKPGHRWRGKWERLADIHVHELHRRPCGAPTFAKPEKLKLTTPTSDASLFICPAENLGDAEWAIFMCREDPEGSCYTGTLRDTGNSLMVISGGKVVFLAPYSSVSSVRRVG